MTASNVKAGDWITIGENVKAVLSSINDNSAEAIYKNTNGKLIVEDIIKTENGWKFKYEGSNGGYAENYDRLDEYVRIFNRGPYWEDQFKR